MVCDGESRSKCACAGQKKRKERTAVKRKDLKKDFAGRIQGWVSGVGQSDDK